MTLQQVAMAINLLNTLMIVVGGMAIIRKINKQK